MDKKHKTAAVILAAGSGQRMGRELPKQLIELLGKSVLKRSVEAFCSSEVIDSVTVVTRVEELELVKNECKSFDKVKNIIIGGKSRAESASKGFCAIENNCDFVLIHDACRCLVTKKEIEDVARAAHESGAATAAVHVVDTLKKCDESGRIINTVYRDNLWAVATPQAFSCELYRRALNAAPLLDAGITDDNMLMEKIGVKVQCVMTLGTNIKITTPSDLELAEFIISKRESRG